MHDALRISVREQRSAGSVLRTATFALAGGSASVFYEIAGDVLPPPLEVHDFALVAGIYAAMREGRPVHVEGPVTVELLRNLEEFQEIWALWRPSCKRVAITAEEVVATSGSPSRNGVFAFSGGVDGAFALLAHQAGLLGLRTAHPACAMLVHGFDIPLREQRAFDRARRGVCEVTRALGIPLAVVRTNWREALGRHWTMECQAALSSCLFQFRGLANVGVCGAAEDYAHIIVPLGCNPVTNHLLTGGGFEIRTEGGCHTRTDRVRFISGYPEVAARLRVCWEGPVTGRNCGVCEKCIRTKLNFMAVGRPPLCFDRPPTLAEILQLKARDPIQLHFLREILSAARKNCVRGPWISALRMAIAKNQLALPLRRLERTAGGARSRLAALLGAGPGAAAAQRVRPAAAGEHGQA